MQKLNFINKSQENSNKAIIFIHGWKGNKSSFESLPSMLKIENVEWFFPEAPYVLENNDRLRSWARQNGDGTYEVGKSKTLLENFLLNNVLIKFSPENIFFIGFSQGATVCYEFILSLEYPWGGVFPVAGFFRDWNRGLNLHPNQKATIICIGHGISDDVVSIEESEKIHNYLLDHDFNCTLMRYNGGHKISLNYLKHVSKYILNK